ncbi:MAG TPA: hypothetical protein ACFYEK_01415 [Candidatus Wunengus sp. YC60]|uniref:hypothetical protein n=1 Tax=Candidatus Wunengus sp. YC60 TaxID=3367697 RepID=UPI0040253616
MAKNRTKQIVSIITCVVALPIMLCIFCAGFMEILVGIQAINTPNADPVSLIANGGTKLLVLAVPLILMLSKNNKK